VGSSTGERFSSDVQTGRLTYTSAVGVTVEPICRRACRTSFLIGCRRPGDPPHPLFLKGVGDEVSASASIANRNLEAPQPMRWRYPAMTPTFCCGTGSRPPGVPDASSVSTLALAWRGCGGIAPNGSPDALVACRYALLCLQRISAQHRTLEQPNEVRLGNRQRDAFSFGFSDRANLIYHQL
jgi:hypothetical protein